MQLHDVKPKAKKQGKKRIGRGGKRGTYSGRGMKGQKSRAGNRPAPVVRELLKRYPKLKGYRGVKRKRKPQSVSLARIQEKFSKGEVVSPTTLFEKGLIAKEKGRFLKVKIVGKAELKEALSFQDCTFSEAAKKVVQKSGGNIT